MVIPKIFLFYNKNHHEGTIHHKGRENRDKLSKTLQNFAGKKRRNIFTNFLILYSCKSLQATSFENLMNFFGPKYQFLFNNATTIQLYAKCDLHWYWIILKLDYKFWLTSTVLKSVTYFKIKKLQIQKVNIFMQLKKKE